MKNKRKCPVYCYYPEELGKDILDCCCGGKMFWYDKDNPDVLFGDIRAVQEKLGDGRVLNVSPDMIMDFTDLPFQDNLFRMVVFDPPHLLYAGPNSWLRKKYGILPKDWKPYLKAGFDECIRVLKPGCFLVFKWNEEQIATADVLKAIGTRPLLGDKRSKTRWMIFAK